jgi:hypothetical protein
MRNDDWITKLYIMENLNKTSAKYIVPAKLGWMKLENCESEYPDDKDRFVVDWVDNTENFTFNQAQQVCDMVSSETKEVDFVMAEDTFVHNFYSY